MRSVNAGQKSQEALDSFGDLKTKGCRRENLLGILQEECLQKRYVRLASYPVSRQSPRGEEKFKLALADSRQTESESGLVILPTFRLIRKRAMADDNLLSYPGFDVALLVPAQHDPDQLDAAIAQIKRDVELSAARYLPSGCLVQLQDTV